MKNISVNNPEQSDRIVNTINSITNGVHLHRIREALGSGHAAVMVGAGFSLNAKNGNRLTLWDGLIENLLRDLYEAETERAAARKRLGGTSGMLRLAEEYAAARTRAQLDKRLHELLPDAGVTMPGDLHTKLLSLDWADVYTTNYDTLLERTLDADRRDFNPRIKRRYQIVVAAEDVPFSKSNGRPRIVKLHGSLRTGSRLIVTEEDYRSYPTNFAPFVNTVQQSMLENVFCLLGFSGDDPNFLAWTGWVRDRLGDKTPPIYLITLKPVQEGQRLTLERRNVFPIDISSLGMSNGKSSAAAALEALFTFWADNSPPRRADWPHEQPSMVLATPDPTFEQLVTWATIARRNRVTYPGWLVAPAGNRARLARKSDVIQATFEYRRHKDKLPLWFRLVFLHEVVWIAEEALSQVGQNGWEEIGLALEQSISDTPQSPQVALPENLKVYKPTELELNAISARLACAMLRNARETSNTAGFDHWLGMLHTLPTVRDTPELLRQVLHEQVLQKLERHQRGEAFRLLEQLDSVDEGGDLFWPIRIGALFAELTWVDRGKERVRSGLHALREAIQFEGETTWLVSREQWAERLLEALNFATEYRRINQRTRNGTTVPPALQLKLPTVDLRDTVPVEEDAQKANKDDDVAVYRDIDARDNIEHPDVQLETLLREIRATDDLFQRNKVDFDDNHDAEASPLPYIRSEALDSAIALCRLVEKAAFVPALGAVGHSGHTLASCCRILSVVHGIESNLRIVFRANNLAAVEALGLAQVSQISRAGALEVFQRSVAEIERIIENRDAKWGATITASLPVALELASRIAFRLDAEHAITLLNIAIQLYVRPQMQDERTLHHVFSRFMKRTLRLLPKAALAAHSLRLFYLSPDSPALLQRSMWPNIIELLTDNEASPAASPDWHPAVDAVLDETPLQRSASDETAAYSFAKLHWLYRCGLMTRAQASRFANLIWQNSEAHLLPNTPGFYRGAVLVWPAPAHRNVSGAFLHWLKSESIESIVTQKEVAGELKRSISTVRESYLANVLLSGNKDVSFIWTREDLLLIVEKLMKWWRDEGPYLAAEAMRDTQWDFAKVILTGRLRLISHIAHRIVSPNIAGSDVKAQPISDWLAELWECGLRLDTPLVPLLFAGLAWWPERSTPVLEMTVSVLGQTADSNVTNVTLNAAGHWLLSEKKESDASRLYLGHLVESVRNRASPCLESRLQNIGELLHLGAALHFESHCETLTRSLSLLLHELQEDESFDNTPFTSVPVLRRPVVGVLVAIGKHLPQAKELNTWKWAMEAAKSDRLLDIRNLVESI